MQIAVVRPLFAVQQPTQRRGAAISGTRHTRGLACQVRCFVEKSPELSRDSTPAEKPASGKGRRGKSGGGTKRASKAKRDPQAAAKTRRGSKDEGSASAASSASPSASDKQQYQAPQLIIAGTAEALQVAESLADHHERELQRAVPPGETSHTALDSEDLPPSQSVTSILAEQASQQIAAMGPQGGVLAASTDPVTTMVAAMVEGAGSEPDEPQSGAQAPAQPAVKAPDTGLATLLDPALHLPPAHTAERAAALGLADAPAASDAPVGHTEIAQEEQQGDGVLYRFGDSGERPSEENAATLPGPDNTTNQQQNEGGVEHKGGDIGGSLGVGRAATAAMLPTGDLPPANPAAPAAAPAVEPAMPPHGAAAGQRTAGDVGGSLGVGRAAALAMLPDTQPHTPTPTPTQTDTDKSVSVTSKAQSPPPPRNPGEHVSESGVIVPDDFVEDSWGTDMLRGPAHRDATASPSPSPEVEQTPHTPPHTTPPVNNIPDTPGSGAPPAAGAPTPAPPKAAVSNDTTGTPKHTTSNPTAPPDFTTTADTGMTSNPTTTASTSMTSPAPVSGLVGESSKAEGPCVSVSTDDELVETETGIESMRAAGKHADAAVAGVASPARAAAVLEAMRADMEPGGLGEDEWLGLRGVEGVADPAASAARDWPYAAADPTRATSPPPAAPLNAADITTQHGVAVRSWSPAEVPDYVSPDNSMSESERGRDMSEKGIDDMSESNGAEEAEHNVMQLLEHPEETLAQLHHQAWGDHVSDPYVLALVDAARAADPHTHDTTHTDTPTTTKDATTQTDSGELLAPSSKREATQATVDTAAEGSVSVGYMCKDVSVGQGTSGANASDIVSMGRVMSVGQDVSVGRGLCVGSKHVSVRNSVSSGSVVGNADVQPHTAGELLQHLNTGPPEEDVFAQGLGNGKGALSAHHVKQRERDLDRFTAESGLSSGEFLAQLNAPLPRDKSPGSDTHHTRTDTHTTPTHHKTGAADSAAARNTDTHTGAAAPAAPEPNGAGAPVTARVLDAATEARLAHLEAVAAEVKGMRREVQSVLSMLKDVKGALAAGTVPVVPVATEATLVQNPAPTADTTTVPAAPSESPADAQAMDTQSVTNAAGSAGEPAAARTKGRGVRWPVLLLMAIAVVLAWTADLLGLGVRNPARLLPQAEQAAVTTLQGRSHWADAERKAEGTEFESEFGEEWQPQSVQAPGREDEATLKIRDGGAEAARAAQS